MIFKSGWDLDTKISNLRRFGEIGDALADILLDLINTMSNIETRLIKIQATTEKLEGSLNQLVGNNEDLRNTLAKLDEKIAEIWRKTSYIELVMGAVSESYLSWRFVEELRTSKTEIIRIERNHIIDNEEIDLIVETPNETYIAEIKVKPRISDIGALLAKTDLLTSKVGIEKKVVPVIIGVYIGKEVSNYARSKNVLVYKF